ncbi:MspA family porin [Mycolicibacterium iranicum]|uniref:MspA family porin n=1 Tax=Mycolicibacterium iranicum TaxID=912594 RepID=A0A1X1X1K6_MYCIR|nr:MspA family porin [Mycolicibacterium iranicum]MCZ0731730.1 MspA family porin [Mycolicibacterium iranicum]ORV92669.1 MspA protein [Mycolicibacterium iranicum]
MKNRFVALALALVALPAAATPLAVAQPPAVPLPSPPPPDAAVLSGPPGVLETPDGWRIEVVGSNESQQAVAPLTTAVSSREYLFGGTYTGTITGDGTTTLTGGTLEVGAQIGCGIISDEQEVNPGGGFTPALPFGDDPTLALSVTLQGKVYLSPGTVTTVPINKKTFKGKSTRVSIDGVRIKTDQCAGQSFIRSYATLTSSSDNADDVITYLGVTKVV